MIYIQYVLTRREEEIDLRSTKATAISLMLERKDKYRGQLLFPSNNLKQIIHVHIYIYICRNAYIRSRRVHDSRTSPPCMRSAYPHFAATSRHYSFFLPPSLSVL